MSFIFMALAGCFVFFFIAYLFTGSKVLSSIISVAALCSILGIGSGTKLNAGDIYDTTVSYEIKFSSFSKNIAIKKIVWDIETQTEKHIFTEKCSFENGNIGQIVERQSIRKNELSKTGTYRPCFFEYKLTSKNSELNGKILRIGLLDKNGRPVREERIKDSSALPGGTIEDIGKSKKYYVQIR